MDLTALKTWLEGLDPNFLAKVKKTYPQINRLLHYCCQTGKLERIGKTNRYIIKKECQQLDQLRALLAELRIGGIKLEKE